MAGLSRARVSRARIRLISLACAPEFSRAERAALARSTSESEYGCGCLYAGACWFKEGRVSLFGSGFNSESEAFSPEQSPKGVS